MSVPSSGRVAIRHPSNGGTAPLQHDRHASVSHAVSGMRKVTFVVWVDQAALGSEQLMGTLQLTVGVRSLDGKMFPEKGLVTIRNNAIDGFFPNFSLTIPVRKTGTRLDGGSLEVIASLTRPGEPYGPWIHSAPAPINFVSNYADLVFFAIPPMPSHNTQTIERDHQGVTAKGTAGGNVGPVKLGGEITTPSNSSKQTVTGPATPPPTSIRLVEVKSQGQPVPQ